MHEPDGAHTNLLYSRAELELELARITLVVQRAVPPAGAGGPDHRTAAAGAPAAWFLAQSEALLRHTSEHHRPYVGQRLLDLASNHPWLGAADSPTLAFAFAFDLPADSRPPPRLPVAPTAVDIEPKETRPPLRDMRLNPR